MLPPSDASGRILTSEVPPRVRLTLHGSRSAINSLVSASLPPVELDLRSGDLDVYYFAEEQFDLPAGVALSQMAPASIPLSWEQRVERQVPIEVDAVGELRSGLVLTGPATPLPETLGVVGPESAVEGLSVLLTTPVNLATLREEGLLGEYGYYESIDYSPTHVPPGRRGVVVKTFMAHHQGMSLVALDNVLWQGEVANPDNRDHQTVALRALNAKIHQDPRVTPVLLPIGDGLTLARRR